MNSINVSKDEDLLKFFSQRERSFFQDLESDPSLGDLGEKLADFLREMGISFKKSSIDIVSFSISTVTSPMSLQSSEL